MSDRSVTVIYDGLKSKNFEVTTGIPQGSPISPLLFNITLAPLYELIEMAGCKIIGYADDLTIYYQSHSHQANTEKLASVLDLTQNWLHARNLKFDTGPKCQFMHFKGKVPITQQQLDYQLPLPDGTSKVPDQQVKLLGVTLDPNLTFKEHQQSVIKRTKAAAGQARRYAYSYRGATPPGPQTGSVQPSSPTQPTLTQAFQQVPAKNSPKKKQKNKNNKTSERSLVRITTNNQFEALFNQTSSPITQDQQPSPNSSGVPEGPLPAGHHPPVSFEEIASQPHWPEHREDEEYIASQDTEVDEPEVSFPPSETQHLRSFSAEQPQNEVRLESVQEEPTQSQALEPSKELQPAAARPTRVARASRSTDRSNPYATSTPSVDDLVLFRVLFMKNGALVPTPQILLRMSKHLCQRVSELVPPEVLPQRSWFHITTDGLGVTQVDVLSSVAEHLPSSLYLENVDSDGVDALLASVNLAPDECEIIHSTYRASGGEALGPSGGDLTNAPASLQEYINSQGGLLLHWNLGSFQSGAVKEGIRVNVHIGYSAILPVGARIPMNQVVEPGFRNRGRY